MDKKIHDFFLEWKEAPLHKRYAGRLLGWCKQRLHMKGKGFGFYPAFECIYKYANGQVSLIDDICDQLWNEANPKLYGRANAAYGDTPLVKVDIRRNEDGEWQLYGYNSNRPKPLKGQHMPDNDKIFKKSDNQVSKPYKITQERLMQIGKYVRELNPGADKDMIEDMILTISNYASSHKKSPMIIINKLRSGQLVIDPLKREITPATNESLGKVIVITEDMARQIQDEMTMTEYKFNNSIKKFLHDLLVDPVNAVVPDILKYNGYKRYYLITLLKNNHLLQKSEKIIDKDENGFDKTATMKVKYKVPKKNFDRKLRNLYIKMFEKNVPENDEEIMTEDGEGGCAMAGTTNASSSGQFSQPLFGLNRRTIYGGVKEDTTCSSVGNYQYDVPFGGDRETLKRNNGIGGSTSINRLK